MIGSKDFQKWHDKKAKVDGNGESPFFHEREVWWVHVGVNIGVEIDGKHELFLRPVIVVRKFNKNMALIVPTTAKDKSLNKYYLEVIGEDGKRYIACLSQIRAVSSKRFFRKVGTIDVAHYSILLKRLTAMILRTL